MDHFLAVVTKILHHHILLLTISLLYFIFHSQRILLVVVYRPGVGGRVDSKQIVYSRVLDTCRHCGVHDTLYLY